MYFYKGGNEANRLPYSFAPFSMQVHAEQWHMQAGLGRMEKLYTAKKLPF